MIKHRGITLIATALLAGMASCAAAHPLLTPVSNHHSRDSFYGGEPIDQMLFSVPSSDESPKLWTEMTPKERAEIWPFLSPKMQRYYWRSMTDAERRDMRAEFSPYINEKFRKRYVSPSNVTPCDDPAHRAGYRLSPEERAKMRQQIREMHMEFHRYHRESRRPIEDSVPPPPEVQSQP